MARRVTLSTALLVGAATLVVAIAVGNSMGNKVLGQIGRAPNVSPTLIAPATPGETPAATQAWKHISLAAVATDPAFPDPRVTPPPPPPPPPPPTSRATPVPRPTHLDTSVPTPIATFDYTSPPLPVPLTTATPADLPTSAPVDSPAPPPPPVTSHATPVGRLTPNAVGP